MNRLQNQRKNNSHSELIGDGLIKFWMNDVYHEQDVWKRLKDASHKIELIINHFDLMQPFETNPRARSRWIPDGNWSKWAQNWKQLCKTDEQRFSVTLSMPKPSNVGGAWCSSSEKIFWKIRQWCQFHQMTQNLVNVLIISDTKSDKREVDHFCLTQ